MSKEEELQKTIDELEAKTENLIILVDALSACVLDHISDVDSKIIERLDELFGVRK